MLNSVSIRQLPLEKYIYFHQNEYSMQLKHELKQVLLHLFQQIYYISTAEIGISVFRKTGKFTFGIEISFCEPGNLPNL